MMCCVLLSKQHKNKIIVYKPAPAAIVWNVSLGLRSLRVYLPAFFPMAVLSGPMPRLPGQDYCSVDFQVHELASVDEVQSVHRVAFACSDC